jgi:VanZ family protein
MTQPQQQRLASQTVVSWLLVLYVLFVVYGSLVPLKYVDRSLIDAVAVFKNIPFLKLGIQSRADWVANGVLYVPVGFLSAAWLTQTFQKIPRVYLFAVAAAFSMALAVGVEFTQLFFPQRTVSLNDLLAEVIGSLIGLALAGRFTEWFRGLLISFLHDPQRLRLRLLEAYVVAYFVFALFPYDLLLSWAELEGKYDSSSWGWLVAGNTPRFILAVFQLLTEAALTAPFGFLLLRLLGGRAATYKNAVLTGLLLGIGVEFAQFFIASGISQGISIFSRTLGVCGGVALYRHRSYWTAEQVAFTLRRYTLPLGVVYLVALLEINGWRTSSWQGLAVAAQQLDQLKFIPGYYHYFTTEAKALFSLTIVCMSYVPIGVLAWAHHRSVRLAMLFALLLASAMEAGKLFLPLSHPDLTNLLLACAASGFTVWLLRQFMSPQVMDCRVAGAPRNDEVRGVAREAVIASAARQSMPPESIRPQSIWPYLSLLATGLWVFNFPAFPWVVGLVLAACALAVWFRPTWAFVIIPAALPVFDLAPWSGRFFLDEFDALLVVTLAAAFARAPALPRARFQRDAVFASAAMLLGLSFVISAVLGIMPFQLPNANAFNNYFSPYNALRIFKGAAWAYLVYALARRFLTNGVDVRRPFAWGMSMGLAGTVAVIMWERVAFSGLWNFATGYRVTGPFSAIHVGGAYIECFLAAATPFVMMLMLEKRHWFARVAGVVLLLATTYALMVTFSRNGYTAFAVAVAISLLVALRQTKRLIRSSVLLAGLAGAMLLVAVPIFKGEFSQARMATVRADLGVRQAHWDDALAIRDTGWVTSTFGMGLGRYPETNFWRSAEGHRTGTYRLEAASGNNYLRMSSGDSLYMEQLVGVEPGQSYVLKLDVRASVANAKITVPICEKWMLTSYNCIWQTLSSGNEVGTWRSLETRFVAKELSISPWFSQRPVKLSLYYAVPNSSIDIDNVRLETVQGANLLSNGDFSNGLDHWFFSTDGHLQWHIKSLFYGVLFDQGWFGLVAFLGFLGLVLVSAARNAFHGDKLSGAGLAALSSFLVVGLFDTLIDTPRFLLLMLLLVWFCRQSNQVPHTTRNSANATDSRVRQILKKP